MKLIVAVCKSFGIGINNKIPWKLKNDLQYFKGLTTGHGDNAVIMGRKTWESLPEKFKPLPKRKNIILSRKNYRSEDPTIKTCSSLEEAKIYCKDYNDIWIIGGEQIYIQALEDEDLTHIHITEVKKEYECDTFFPHLAVNKWKLEKSSDLEFENKIPYYFKVYKKI
jgi:dihydrofolate reductase